MNDSTYIGDELTVFQDAVNWKAYFASRLAPFVRGDVLEVGAGIGGTARALCDGRQSSWLCFGPDPALVAKLQESGRGRPFALPPEVQVGGLAAIDPARRFDAI